MEYKADITRKPVIRKYTNRMTGKTRNILYNPVLVDGINNAYMDEDNNLFTLGILGMFYIPSRMLEKIQK